MTNDKLTIRPAQLDDVAFIRSCAVAAYSHYTSRIGKPPAPMVADFEHFVARGETDILESPTGVVGFAITYPRGDHLFIENVAVHPNYQGKGIARKLFDFLDQRAVDKGLTALELYTNEKMTENLGLYPHLGYKETKRRKEDEFKRVYFRKELQ